MQSGDPIRTCPDCFQMRWWSRLPRSGREWVCAVCHAPPPPDHRGVVRPFTKRKKKKAA